MKKRTKKSKRSSRESSASPNAVLKDGKTALMSSDATSDLEKATLASELEIAKSLPKELPKSITSTLPKHLKDPANFERIYKKIYDSFYLSGERACFHSDVGEMAACVKCTKRMLNRRSVLKELGFDPDNPSQLLGWMKIHMEIRRRYPLVDWKSGNQINR